LIKALRDKNIFVRWAAAKALRRIRDADCARRKFLKKLRGW
jgi:HEAT repeat protein